jgi:hypothetical protein
MNARLSSAALLRLRDLTVLFPQIAVEMKTEQTPSGALHQHGRFVTRRYLPARRFLPCHLICVFNKARNPRTPAR